MNHALADILDPRPQSRVSSLRLSRTFLEDGYRVMAPAPDQGDVLLARFDSAYAAQRHLLALRRQNHSLAPYAFVVDLDGAVLTHSGDLQGDELY